MRRAADGASGILRSRRPPPTAGGGRILQNGTPINAIGCRRNRQRTNEILRFKRRHKAESHNTKRRLYRRENLEKLRKRAREYYRKHFARKRAEHRNAIAKRKRAKGRFTAREFLLVLKKHKYRCAYCKRQISRSSATIDHVVPLSRGGTNWITNIIPACLRCNQRKSFMSLGRFIARLKKEGDLDQ